MSFMSSFEDKILKNKKAGLHTLCLLDIKVKEQSESRLRSEVELSVARLRIS